MSLLMALQGFTSGSLRAKDIGITIKVLDTNNQAPLLEGMENGRFYATVPENAVAGTSVRTVRVNDKDENDAFKRVRLF